MLVILQKRGLAGGQFDTLASSGCRGCRHNFNRRQFRPEPLDSGLCEIRGGHEYHSSIRRRLSQLNPPAYDQFLGQLAQPRLIYLQILQESALRDSLPGGREFNNPDENPGVFASQDRSNIFPPL